MTVLLLDALCQPDGSFPSTVLIAAHPDDEVIGAAGRLARIDPLVIVHTTDGAPSDMRDAHAAGCSSRHDYARLRRAELLEALKLCGIGGDRTRQIGLTDQEASYHLADLTRAVAGILLEAAPQVVLTQAYEGGHPDHDATAFAVSGARRLLLRDGRSAPVIVEFTGYNAGVDGSMRISEFLPAADAAVPTRDLTLSAEDAMLKRRMLDCFRSQQAILEPFYLPSAVERFRLAPDYCFESPPHSGTLLYERFPWRMIGRLWRSLAADALRELGLLPDQS